MTRILLAVLLTCWLTSCGCESGSPPPVSPATTTVFPEPSLAEPAAKTTSETEKSLPAVTLSILNWEQTLELVARHKGKVVVLDLWSTSCEPCMIEFPHLVELHKQHGDQLVCMSASCDYAGIKNMPPESYRDGVLEFLTKQNATFTNVLLNIDSDTLFEKLELGSIPAVYVFGRDGKVAKRFDNDNAKPGDEFTYAKDIVPFVEKLLAE